MNKLSHLACASASTALVFGVSLPAHAAEPSRYSDHITDVLPCGDPDNPAFVLSYEADFTGLVHSPVQGGNDDAAAAHGESRDLEVYSINGHSLTVSALADSRESTVSIVGDRRFVTGSSSGLTEWALDGKVLSRAAGTLRYAYSANTNGTPDDRSDDFDYQGTDPWTPGAGHNWGNAVDPCEALAPYAS